jgi:xanthine dehydrogenase accessory factor
MDDLKIYEEMIALSRQGSPCALATVVESAGSSPRKAGAKMLVRHDGSTLGTVGGGRLELETVEAALATLQHGEPRTLPFDLTEEYGHVCGGRLLVYVEPALPAPHLLIVGAGHVGRALTTAARGAGFRVTVADDRPDYATREQLPEADEVHLGEGAELLGRLPVGAGTCVVITTTGFEKDFAAVRAALATPAGYIGVIGSKRKREVLVQTLTAEGYAPSDIGRVTIPVGLAIGAETPAEIAVSIVAQLIRERRRHGAASIGDSPGRRAIPADGELQTAAAAP